VKLELANLKAVSQLDARYTLAKTTHHVSVFTEGMLQMKSTLLGIVEVDPRAILQDGIRKELVRQISSALHKGLVFDLRTGRKRNPVEVRVAVLWLWLCNGTRECSPGFVVVVADGASGSAGGACTPRRIPQVVRVHPGLHQHVRGAAVVSFMGHDVTYLVGWWCVRRSYGLKMWQEEFSRILSFNVEQECNRYQRRTIMPMDSVYQSREIPVPLFPPVRFPPCCVPRRG